MSIDVWVEQLFKAVQASGGGWMAWLVGIGLLLAVVALRLLWKAKKFRLVIDYQSED